MDIFLKALYPELNTFGGLAGALQEALIRVGSSIEVDRPGEGVHPGYHAVVRSSGRVARVTIGAEERWFVLEFWARGVTLASGKTPDLDQAALAIDRWVGSNLDTSKIADSFEFVEPREHALAFEQGVEVEHRWRHYLDHLAEDQPRLDPIVRSAALRPELRHLFPYTSLFHLCFSRCSGYPYSGDIPSISPAEGGGYRVSDPSRKPLVESDLESALDLLIAHLPPGCGAAISGTADELRQR